MPPRKDDVDVTSKQFLLRVLKPKWTTTKDGKERPTKDSLTDTNYENSCFIEGEISLEEIGRLFPGLKVAKFPVSAMREAGFVVERAPEEAPLGCSNPRSHVHVGPTASIRRLAYEKAAKSIVTSEEVDILNSDLA